MEAPANLNREDKKAWGELFANFTPKSAVEIDMAKRYIFWRNVSLSAQKAMNGGKKGRVTKYRNKELGVSQEFKAAAEAENQMKRLWAQLRGSFATAKKENLGEFDDI